MAGEECRYVAEELESKKDEAGVEEVELAYRYREAAVETGEGGAVATREEEAVAAVPRQTKRAVGRGDCHALCHRLFARHQVHFLLGRRSSYQRTATLSRASGCASEGPF